MSSRPRIRCNLLVAVDVDVVWRGSEEITRKSRSEPGTVMIQVYYQSISMR
jgi:hypothetical protein